jgi:hypothetical protein
LSIPVIECHLSNPAARETFRRHTFVSLAATGIVSGFGAASYELAIEAAFGLIGGARRFSAAEALKKQGKLPCRTPRPPPIRSKLRPSTLVWSASWRTS